MLNIMYNEKVRNNCILEKCEAYKFILALSNNGELDGVAVCPEIFCNRMKLSNTCSSCGKNKSIFEGYFDQDAFKCYNCEEKTEEKIDIIEPEVIKDVFSRIDNFMIEQTKNNNFMALYADISDDEQKIRFFNPFNSYADPLIINVSESFEQIQTKLLSFFDTMIKKGGEQNG